MPLFGTDLSKFNGDTDHAALKRGGIRFAMVKATQGHALSSDHYLFTDSRFVRNVEGLSAQRIPIGCYHFFTASNLSEAHREADFFLETVRPYRDKISLYLACDAENYGNRWLLNQSPALLTSLIDGFCRRVAADGFAPCVYTNTDHIRHFIRLEELPWPIWQAHYGSNVSKPSDAGDRLAIHQYTGSGSIPGAVGIYDLNFGYGPLAERIILDRVGYEEQTFAYIKKCPTGEAILTKMADKLAAGGLRPIRNPSHERIVPLLRYFCGFTVEETAYLLRYRWAVDLFAKLYRGILKFSEKGGDAM